MTIKEKYEPQRAVRNTDVSYPPVDISKLPKLKPSSVIALGFNCVKYVQKSPEHYAFTRALVHRSLYDRPNELTHISLPGAYQAAKLGLPVGGNGIALLKDMSNEELRIFWALSSWDIFKFKRFYTLCKFDPPKTMPKDMLSKFQYDRTNGDPLLVRLKIWHTWLKERDM